MFFKPREEPCLSSGSVLPEPAYRRYAAAIFDPEHQIDD
jgi:hypothetical protein